MFGTDMYFDYVKKFIDRTYEQRKVILSDPNLSTDQIEGIKKGTVAYCTGYIVGLTSFQILSEGAQKVLEDYIAKRNEES